MSRKGERLFVLTQTDHHGERKGRVRNYARLDTAAARAVQLLVIAGEPGDVMELAHTGTGAQLGWAKVKANGTVTCCWDWKL